MNHMTRAVSMAGAAALLLVACGGGGGGGGGDDGNGSQNEALPSTVHVAAIVPPGAECPAGGVSVDSGIDDNANGVLDPDEVDETQILCNGADGSDGKDGDDGLASLIDLTDVAPGGECANGGLRVDTGRDVDGDGLLDPGEVESTALVCRPEPAASFDGLIYRADAEVRGQHALYATTRDGGRITRVASLPYVGVQIATGVGRGPRLSPDRGKLAFVLDFGTESFIHVTDLLAGGPAERISGPIARDVLEFLWSPNGDRLLYRGRNDNGDVGVYTVFADGSLERAIVDERALGGLTWSPDGTRITYISDFAEPLEQELYINSPDAGAQLLLSAPLATGDDALLFRRGVQWAPDGSRVAYLARTGAANTDHIFTVLPDGTGHLRVTNPAMIDAGDVLQSFIWAPDGSRIAYFADESVDGEFGLFTTVPDTGVRRTLAPLVTTDSNLISGLGADITMLAWSPDSAEVAFVAERLTPDVFELFVAAADGSSVRLVSGTMVENGDIGGTNTPTLDPLFAWSPDSSRIAYRADSVLNNTTQLFLADRGGTTVTPVSLNTGAFQNVFDFAWSPDGTWLAYIAPEDIAGATELYAVTPDLTDRRKLSTPAASANEDVFNGLQWSPDSALLAYLADRDPGRGQVAELFTVAVGADPVRVSGDLVEGADVDDFFWE